MNTVCAHCKESFGRHCFTSIADFDNDSRVYFCGKDCAQEWIKEKAKEGNFFYRRGHHRHRLVR